MLTVLRTCRPPVPLFWPLPNHRSLWSQARAILASTSLIILLSFFIYSSIRQSIKQRRFTKLTDCISCHDDLTVHINWQVSQKSRDEEERERRESQRLVTTKRQDICALTTLWYIRLHFSYSTFATNAHYKITSLTRLWCFAQQRRWRAGAPRVSTLFQRKIHFIRPILRGALYRAMRLIASMGSFLLCSTFHIYRSVQLTCVSVLPILWLTDLLSISARTLYSCGFYFLFTLFAAWRIFSHERIR